MSIELKIPDVGESIQEVQIGKWLKQEGDTIELDEDLVELETDKASMELPAPAPGVLARIVKSDGETVSVGDVIGYIEERAEEAAEGDTADGTAESEAGQGRQPADGDEPTGRREDESQEDQEEDQDEERPSRSADRRHDEGLPRETTAASNDRQSPHATQAAGPKKLSAESDGDRPSQSGRATVPATPSARRALREHGLTADEVSASGSRLRPEDVERHVRETSRQRAGASPPEKKSAAQPADERAEAELEEIVPMSLIRRRIAETLVTAQQTAALLTTFNEIDMSAVMELRRKYREEFEETYGVHLGYMPFFVKAAIDALRHVPELNAEIRADNIVYRDYCHIGVAVGGGKGLVVPVLRFAERMSFADIEDAIGDFARRAEANKLDIDELQGGTFTITNGGVYGSLLSTPVVNPPQSGVLGMHAIQERPVARDGQVVIRPMMYVALTYDHRLVDGREAVTFLRRVKEAIEDPARMLIEV